MFRWQVPVFNELVLTFFFLLNLFKIWSIGYFATLCSFWISNFDSLDQFSEPDTCNIVSHIFRKVDLNRVYHVLFTSLTSVGQLLQP